jgi:hypothetical protein
VDTPKKIITRVLRLVRRGLFDSLNERVDADGDLRIQLEECLEKSPRYSPEIVRLKAGEWISE